MTVTGERVTTAERGWGPTWQRHVAAYKECAPLLPEGPVLDLGCGTGHSYHLLAPRETVGVDLDADSLLDQARETRVADMCRLPFENGAFASVLAVQSLEHVPEPDQAVAEAARVIAPAGTAVFVTPNRLTFARADEIIDPYHYFEWDADELRALCGRHFAEVELRGIHGSERYRALVDTEHRRLNRLLRLDPLCLRRRVPRRIRQRLYDAMLTRARRHPDPAAESIAVEDFWLSAEDLASALDLVAVCRHPLRETGTP